MTTNQNSHPSISESDFVDVYLGQPWNPFEREMPHKEAFPSSLVFQAHWPIGLFICALLTSGRTSPIPSHIRQGLPDLAEFHFPTPLDRLTQRVVADDEVHVRLRGRVVAEERLRLARLLSPGREREHRIRIAEESIERDGAHRWTVYLAAIAALRLFAAHAGVRAADLPTEPTARLRVAQNNPISRRVLTPNEMESVWGAAESFRDSELALLILDLVRETGARRQSVIDLRLDDICWDSSCIWLHTKGNRMHRQVVSQDLLERIALRSLEFGWDGSDKGDTNRASTWQSDVGKSALRRDNGEPLTDRWFDNFHNFINRQIELVDGKRFSLHYLRHTSIAQVERIAGYFVAEQFAGHRAGGHGETRGSATSIYIRWGMNENKQLFTAMFPETFPGKIEPLVMAEKLVWLSERGLES